MREKDANASVASRPASDPERAGGYSQRAIQRPLGAASNLFPFLAEARASLPLIYVSHRRGPTPPPPPPAAA